MRAARMVATALVAASLGAALWSVAHSDSLARLFQTDPAEPARPSAPWAGFSTGWTELPKPPELRDGAAFVWTGAELLAWGGCDRAVGDDCTPTADGFAFDPAAGAWRAIPAAAVASAHAPGLWTGREAIFVGPAGDARLGGQAFNPATDAWRTIATAPMAFRSDIVAVWTGSELIAWGGGKPEQDTVFTGAAYDPDLDEWRRISDAPIGLNSATGVWTGNEMLVFGSLLGERNIATTATAVGAAYDPVTDEWHKLPPSALSAQATSAAWVGDGLLAYDEAHSQTYDLVADTWSPPIKVPVGVNECYPDSVAMRDVVFGFYCGRAALYDVTTGTWNEIHGGPLEAEVEAAGGSYRLWRFASLVPAGEVVILAMEGITVDGGQVCYGCSGFPVSLWVYRPTS